MNLKNLRDNSMKIRQLYHQLEEKYHRSIWSIEEDALAFLTDAGIVGRLTMANQGRWPSENEKELQSKIGECVWWLVVLSERMNLNFEDCIQIFMEEKLKQLK